LEATVLLAYTLQVPRTALYAWPERELQGEEHHQFQHYLERRLRGEPVAYITGQCEFWSLDLRVTIDTLVPRNDTELLIEYILNQLPQGSAAKVADLGTGSGAIALALASECPEWEIHATDASKSALMIAKENAHTHDFSSIHFHEGDWCAALPQIQFDAILSNPPYIAESEWSQFAEGLQFEPRDALVSGLDGLAAIKKIINDAQSYLKSGGQLCLEHGFAQGQAVRELMIQAGYQAVRTWHDIANRERVTVGLNP
jgi:release factor glutamine methyltransferase